MKNAALFFAWNYKKAWYRILPARNCHARYNVEIEKENGIGRQLAKLPTTYDLCIGIRV